MKRTGAGPQAAILGLFLFLAAAVFAVAPLPPVLRSALILLTGYSAFTFAGMPWAYATVLVAPAIGLLSGSSDWLVMLPIILASNLLAFLGLDYAWRLPALVISPLLQVTPQLVAVTLARQELFFVELPWGTGSGTWIALHGLVALLGMLLALIMDRRRQNRTVSA